MSDINTQNAGDTETKIVKISNDSPLVNGKLFVSPGTSPQQSQNWTVRPTISSCSAERMIPLNSKCPVNNNQTNLIKVPKMPDT